MYLDRFLEEYRDYLQAKDPIDESYPELLTEFEKYILDVNMIEVLNLFRYNLEYLESNIDKIEGDIISLYDNLSNKIDKVVDLSESYQRLNTHEFNKSASINNLIIYDLKSRQAFDHYLNSLSLPRIGVIKNLRPEGVDRSNIGSVESYRVPSGRSDSLVSIKVLDENNTSLKRSVCVSKSGLELLSTTDKVFNIPTGTNTVKVITDNVDISKPSYTSVDLLTHNYSQYLRVSFEDKLFRKEGKQLKLVIDKDVPTDCYITGKLTVRYGSVLESVYFNVGNGKKILTPHSESKGITTDLYGNVVSEDSVENDDLVLGDEYSTNESIIKYKGNGVFDISRINSKTFNVNLSFSLYSVSNNTKTPQIKGLYAYVTD